MRVRITQIDGALPNLALMKLAHWHRSNGHDVVITREIDPQLWEREYDIVYGSAIFEFSSHLVDHFKRQWPTAVLGGTGTLNLVTVEDHINLKDYENYSYDGFTRVKDRKEFPVTFSMGFTQRGCRLNCGFCVVGKKEGSNVGLNPISAIWRGEPFPKHLHLLDNDFFGQPEWEKRIDEIVDGKFKVCLSQGINVRLLNKTPGACEALARIQYRNTDFTEKRLYTAWDNIGHERTFFRGVDMLEKAGVPPGHLMAYMLVGYDKNETWDKIWHRFNMMIARGIQPYPMVYDRSRRDLTNFQRWVIKGLYRIVPWDEYIGSASKKKVDRALGRLGGSAQKSLFAQGQCV